MFFFGCWNRDGCMIDDSPLNQVVDLIIENEANNYEFGIIAGDNSYSNSQVVGRGPPPKHKKIKHRTHYSQIINNGIQCIRRIHPDRPIEFQAVLGNHDVEENHTGECVALDRQVENRFIESNFYTKTHKNSFFIFIDTNIFPLVLSDETKTILPKCYSIAPTNFITTKIRVDQFFAECVAKCTEIKFDHIFIIGHEPMITVKRKQGVTIPIPHKLLKIMIHHFFRFNTTINYLCADTHNYQYAVIECPPHQPITHVISGTGGAELDAIDIRSYNGATDDMNYQIREIDVRYGYTEIRIDGKSIQYNFIPVKQKHDEPAYKAQLSALYTHLDSESKNGVRVGRVDRPLVGMDDPSFVGTDDRSFVGTDAKSALQLRPEYKTTKTKYINLVRTMNR